MKITLEFENREDAEIYNSDGTLFPTSRWSEKGYKIIVKAAESFTIDKLKVKK